MKSVICIIKVEKHAIKCPAFRFVKDNRILFTNKKKYADVYIGDGSEVYIRKKSNHIGHINQDGTNLLNMIHTKDTQFQLRYVNYGKHGHIPLDVSFHLDRKTIIWVPKIPEYEQMTKYHHTPIRF